MNVILINTMDSSKAGGNKIVRFASQAVVCGDDDQKGDTLIRRENEGVPDFMLRVRGRLAELA
jgi:hypothetical protein